jgi:hypothetical protein
MNEEHVNYLKEVYPELYKDKKYGGFAVGDGWFDIINMMSRNIQSHLRWKPEVPPVEVQQVKEKFGTLRFYYQGGDDYIRGLTSMAEAMSEVTCQECGKPGKLRQGGWMVTLCDQHYEEREIKKHLREGFEE